MTADAAVQFVFVTLLAGVSLDESVCKRTWGGRGRRRTPEITIRAPVTHAATATQRRAGGQRAWGQHPGTGRKPVLAGTHILSGLRLGDKVRLRFAL